MQIEQYEVPKIRLAGQFGPLPLQDERGCRPGLSAFSYVLSDAIVLILAWSVAAGVRLAFHGDYSMGWYLRLWPIFLVCLATYATRGLYSGAGMSPVEEFRRLTISTSMVYTSLIVFTFLLHEAEAYSRLVFLAAWLLSVVSVPLSRAGVRRFVSTKGWWGTAAVVLGAGPTAAVVLRVLQADTTHGIRVKGLFGNSTQSQIEGIPVLGGLERVPEAVRQNHITTAIVALPDLGATPLHEILDEYGKYFSQLLIVPDVRGITNLCVEARGVGHLMTIRVRQNLLLTGPRLSKRILDVTLALCGGIVLLPLIALTALAVKLTSSGPVFYGHTRIGKGQRSFKAWKFRTMVTDSDRILREHLARDPLLRAEWQSTHKLRRDPRVTVIGPFLRRTSIDELPQLWNVLRGEMSLIGPRPIVLEEVARYADRFDAYTRVLPGITGLWQVSGRNNTDYQRRVELDAYYVHNWSPWLDLYVLARTVRAVIDGRGAY